MHKETSTNAINRKSLNEECGMAYTLAVIGGRWKLSILGFLMNGEKLRYNEIRRKLVGVSERMLITQLKELERDGLIERTVYADVPPKVDYQLTDLGNSLQEILNAMADWGDIHREKLQQE
ncbi:winged helix-turn-helix transcriptional regulator [Spirosoma endbachense]|uniref:Transcriptional regulator n=1 Tax=Spirosoma endbachense TaxID=2666025 RepID=A0A6P1VTZ6_9BACT|nr:helix-turn-helix domain-containing protein [Spirosoma endbachense]QHV95217.1 transcriptional regulator [Spirosoma endbachense]